METLTTSDCGTLMLLGPHSLGTLIEWKQAVRHYAFFCDLWVYDVPTRWGH